MFWKFRSPVTQLPKKLPLHPRALELLSQRGADHDTAAEGFLFPDYERDLHDPFLFHDMERIVERIGEARTSGECVGIFGDFDADGVTSSVIMRQALTDIGVPSFPYLPDKLKEGHGLSLEAITAFESQGIKLILTLDCGMMNHTEILEAKKRGIATIVIDHHHVPEVLPDAFAIVNPKLPGEGYPFRELCGAGTSFKVATALYERFLPEKRDQLKWYLDVVAIGTVADVMPLVGENRAIVKYGLIVLQKTRRVGLQEMFAVGRIPISENLAPDAHTIAFQVAPRINAASRMAHPMVAHNLLMESDRVQARALALELEAYNVARQKVSQEVSDEIRALAIEKFSDKKFIFAVDPHYPLGIIGLVAGKIARELGKPTCILEKGETTSRGSFRSIPGLNIIEAVEQCADLLEKYGGHEQAAGMTIANENLETFYEKFDAIVEEKLSGIVPEPELMIDLRLSAHDVSLSLVRDLRALEPFGEGNPMPIFVLERVIIAEARKVGKDGKHWKLAILPQGSEKRVDAVGWSMVQAFPAFDLHQRYDIAFELTENGWNGTAAVQLKLLDLRPSP